MLSNEDLAGELEALAKQARELAGEVKRTDDLPARTLAAGLVGVDKLRSRLDKIGEQLQNGNGRTRK